MVRGFSRANRSRVHPAKRQTLQRRDSCSRRAVARASPARRARRTPVHPTQANQNSTAIHVARLLQKLGLRDRVQAVVFAYEHELVRPGG